MHTMNIITIFTLLLCSLWMIRSNSEKLVYGVVSTKQSTAQTAKSDSIPKWPNPETVLVEGGTFRNQTVNQEMAERTNFGFTSIEPGQYLSIQKNRGTEIDRGSDHQRE